MKWTRCEMGYVSACGRAKIERYRGGWRTAFADGVGPNGLPENITDTLREAKLIAEAAILRADNRTGLRDELHQRLADGERYRAALEALRPLIDSPAPVVDATGRTSQPT